MLLIFHFVEYGSIGYGVPTLEVSIFFSYQHLLMLEIEIFSCNHIFLKVLYVKVGPILVSFPIQSSLIEQWITYENMYLI